MKTKSVLKTTAVAALGSAAMMVAVSGCASAKSEIPHWPIVKRIKNEPPVPVNEQPLVVDEAMQQRDWDRSSARYTSGDTIAGSTGFLLEPAWNEPEWFYAAEETPLFVGQTIALPVTLAMIPPWKQVRWTGQTIPPTYTAMPVLPPMQETTEMTPPPTEEMTPPPENPAPATQP